MSNPEPIGVAEKLHKSVFGLPKWLIAATSAILGAAGWGLIEWLSPDKLRWSLPARLVLLTVLGIALLYLVLGLLYLRLWLHSRTRLAFGVLWDMKNNPVCAGCRGPLSKKTGESFQCPACQIAYPVYDDFRGPCYIWDVLSTVRKYGPKAKLVRE